MTSARSAPGEASMPPELKARSWALNVPLVRSTKERPRVRSRRVPFVNGAPSNRLNTTALGATPAMVAVAHADGSAVSASDPATGGEVLVA